MLSPGIYNLSCSTWYGFCTYYLSGFYPYKNKLISGGNIMVLLRTKTGFLKIVIMTVPGLICIGIVFMIIGCSLIHKSDGGEFSPDLDDCVVNHMLENRPDILEYFGAQGMDTSRSNWENIVIEWSKVDPEGFEDARQRGLNECIVGLPPCNPPSPYYPSSMAIAECIKLYTEQLAGNKNECWSDYVKNCKNWDIWIYLSRYINNYH